MLAPGVQGNTFRRNLVVGNPPLQIAIDHSPSTGVDIKILATAGANTFTDNICLSGLNAPCPAVSPGKNSLLEDELQFAACGTYPPAESCQFTVSEWNFYLVTKIDQNAQGLQIGDGTQEMTVQQYLQARVAAGI